MVDKRIVTSKISSVKKSISRLNEKKNIKWLEFKSNLDLQDIIMHNLQTAIQGCIDIASHIISDEDWRIPDTLSGLFDILSERKVIDKRMHKTMKAMVGFRNIIIHEYATVDIKKVYSIIKNNLKDFDIFLKQICKFARL